MFEKNVRHLQDIFIGIILLMYFAAYPHLKL